MFAVCVDYVYCRKLVPVYMKTVSLNHSVAQGDLKLMILSALAFLGIEITKVCHQPSGR